MHLLTLFLIYLSLLPLRLSCPETSSLKEQAVSNSCMHVREECPDVQLRGTGQAPNIHLSKFKEERGIIKEQNLAKIIFLFEDKKIAI